MRLVSGPAHESSGKLYALNSIVRAALFSLAELVRSGNAVAEELMESTMKHRKALNGRNREEFFMLIKLKS